jgi:hypothetical protein
MSSAKRAPPMTPGPEPADTQQSPVTAIDMALEPDQTVVGHAQAANAILLKNFPKGFSRPPQFISSVITARPAGSSRPSRQKAEVRQLAARCGSRCPLSAKGKVRNRNGFDMCAVRPFDAA